MNDSVLVRATRVAKPVPGKSHVVINASFGWGNETTPMTAIVPDDEIAGDDPALGCAVAVIGAGMFWLGAAIAGGIVWWLR